MKNIIILISFTMILFGCNKSDYSTNNTVIPPAAPHTFSAGGTTFSPNLDSASVGDTIKFVWSNGSHTTTSVSVPTGAAPWNAPLTSANPSFNYIITVAGIYNFHCNIHYTMGMTGTIVAH
jgi:plastocyanin